jgi:hypothetical protein
MRWQARSVLSSQSDDPVPHCLREVALKPKCCKSDGERTVLSDHVDLHGTREYTRVSVNTSGTPFRMAKAARRCSNL